MIEKTVEIVNRAGLHVRPAAMIVKIASKFESEFYLSRDGFKINGKSIIGVMTLAAPRGSKLTVHFKGGDEEKMAEEIVSYFERGFDEP